MKLSKKKIINLCIKFRQKSAKAFLGHNYDLCLKYLQAVAYTNYTFYQGYKDDEIENILNKLSLKLKQQPFKMFVKENRCVFYDSFSLNNKGLTQQYLRAIFNAGWELLYVTETPKNYKYSRDIITELLQYPFSTIVYIPHNLSGLKRSQYIYDKIMDFNPSKLFMHITPWSVEATTAFYKIPKSVIKYQINLTDHTFWIGSKCLDYSLEFRNYGATISKKFRGISQNNIFILPYYPIVNNSTFRGFPSQCKDKVVIFSGGSYYKIVDGNNTYLELVKKILDTYKETIVLFAGDGKQNLFKHFISENKYEERFCLLGYRSDIDEVFRNCDIYLDTYPVGGGLMCQYAAKNSKPILCFEPTQANTLENFLCQVDYENITTHTIEDFLEEAKCLITDKEYRVKKGRAINKGVIDNVQFESLFIRTILSNKNQIKYSLVDDTKMQGFNIYDKIDYENNTKEYFVNIVKILRINAFFDIPIISFNAIFAVFKKYLILIKKKIMLFVCKDSILK